ncbi:MAG: DUF350 domain-containing protein [Gemmataceae bacterium]|nr:DUF350 domain-containing protein [Gemmataceae bacterium]
MLCALFAQTADGLPFWENLFHGAALTLVYGIIGILLLALGFKVFDWLARGLDIEKELAEKQNVAVAIVCAAVLIGVAVIVATVAR